MTDQTIPAEIFSEMPHDQNLAEAQYLVLGAAPGSSLGETHVVAMTGDWYLFHRQDRSDVLTMARLKEGERPRVQDDPFGATLLIPFAGAASEARISLNPSEVSAVNECMAHSWPPPKKEVEEVEPEVSPLEEAQSVGMFDRAMEMAKRASEKTRKLASDPMAATVDQALDVIEFVAARAAKRGTLSHLRVGANINLGLGEVSIEVGYNGDELKELAVKQETGNE